MIISQKNKDKVYKIVGAAMAVHAELGSGLLEAVYSEAMGFELDLQDVGYQREVELPIFYKGMELDKKYRMDIVCGDIIVELKAVAEILPEHRAQLFNYLRLTKKPIGLLINFGEHSLRTEKYYFDPLTNQMQYL